MPNPEIHKMLVTDLSNLVPEVRQMLSDNTMEEILPYQKIEPTYGYHIGYFIPITEEINFDTLPVCMRNLLRYAMKHDCTWIMLDRDAAPIDELPQYP